MLPTHIKLDTSLIIWNLKIVTNISQVQKKCHFLKVHALTFVGSFIEVYRFAKRQVDDLMDVAWDFYMIRQDTGMVDSQE